MIYFPSPEWNLVSNSEHLS